MTNRNPYENGVDIPDFVEKNDKDIDMSVFKMPKDDEERLNIDLDEFDDEDDDEEYTERKLSMKGICIIGGIVIVLLLVAAIVGWGYGISQHNKYADLEAKYSEVETKLTSANTEIVTLKETNATLEQQLKEKETSASESETATGTKMTVTAGVYLRTGAGVKYDYVKVSKLSDDLKLLVNDNGTINVGSSITVYQKTEDDAGRTWGKISNDQEVWICLKDGSETYAK